MCRAVHVVAAPTHSGVYCCIGCVGIDAADAPPYAAAPPACGPSEAAAAYLPATEHVSIIFIIIITATTHMDGAP